jgi:hypothetical protein
MLQGRKKNSDQSQIDNFVTDEESG